MCIYVSWNLECDSEKWAKWAPSISCGRLICIVWIQNLNMEIHRLKSILKLINSNTVIKLQINNLFICTERIFYDIEILNIKVLVHVHYKFILNYIKSNVKIFSDRTINVRLFVRRYSYKDRRINMQQDFRKYRMKFIR